MGMLDRIIRNGYFKDTYRNVEWPPSNEALTTATALDIFNILPFMELNRLNDIDDFNTPSLIWNLYHNDKNEFPVVSNPWQSLWIEYKEFDGTLSLNIGCLITSYGLPPGRCDIYSFIETTKSISLIPFKIICFIHSDGRLSNYTACTALYRNEKRLIDEFYNMDGLEIKLIDFVKNVFIVSMTSLCFINCRNIKIVDRKTNREKKGKKEKKQFIRYHILEIDEFKKVQKNIGNKKKTTDIKKPLHLCRGHFATYTSEAPLFGKVTGTFWKPMHVRGSAEAGAVVKDYKLAKRSSI